MWGKGQDLLHLQGEQELQPIYSMMGDLHFGKYFLRVGPVTSRVTMLASATLISQGAEAKVYKGVLHEEPILLKYRFKKQYRHPSIDVSLTRSRIAGEARALMRCLKSGVNVPGVRMVDLAEGIIGIEWIEGQSVRHLLPGGADDEDESMEEDVDPLVDYGVTRDDLVDMIGTEIARMHQADVIHGDLTTSNLMLRRPTRELILIDFGLAYHSVLVEDKAVDLYVLERAFASTHPDSEVYFARVLEAYAVQMGKGWAQVKKRLDDVRLRGRKRSMVG